MAGRLGLVRLSVLGLKRRGTAVRERQPPIDVSEN
jgi:hypothetical protein